MKKFLSAVLAAALMLGCTFAVSANTPDITEKWGDRFGYYKWVGRYDIPTEKYASVIEVTTDDITYEIGDEVHVDIWYYASEGPNTGALRLLYDTDVFELIETEAEDNGKSGTKKEFLSNATPVVNYDTSGMGGFSNPKNGYIDMTWLLSENGPASNDADMVEDPTVSTGAIFAELTFVVADDAPSGKYSFAIDTEGTLVSPKDPSIVDPNSYFVFWQDSGKMTYEDRIFPKMTCYDAEVTVNGVAPEVPELKLENTEVLYGHYTEDKTEKYAAAAEFVFDATDVEVSDIKSLGFYYIDNENNVPALESLEVASVLEADGKFFATVSDLDLDTVVPLKAYLVLSDDSVVMSDAVEIKATADNTAALDVTYHPSNYTE